MLSFISCHLLQLWSLNVLSFFSHALTSSPSILKSFSHSKNAQSTSVSLVVSLTLCIVSQWPQLDPWKTAISLENNAQFIFTNLSQVSNGALNIFITATQLIHFVELIVQFYWGGGGSVELTPHIFYPLIFIFILGFGDIHFHISSERSFV